MNCLYTNVANFLQRHFSFLGYPCSKRPLVQSSRIWRYLEEWSCQPFFEAILVIKRSMPHSSEPIEMACFFVRLPTRFSIDEIQFTLFGENCKAVYDDCADHLVAWPIFPDLRMKINSRSSDFLERATRVELATFSLGSWHSTTELRPLGLIS